MKKLLLSFVCLAAFMGSASAQNPFHFDFHGFVNPHYYADSRSVVGGREEMMLFYPKPILPDSLGNDLNDGWQADMLAITARMGLRISGPDMLGAKTTAYVEGDFTGSTNATINDLRLRHAYIDMVWNTHHGIGRHDSVAGYHRLLAGQYWYAMVIHEIMPMTNPLNMGSPFHCYARQPQVRYEYRLHNFEAVAVAQWQLDNMSQGLLNGIPTASTQFARHSMVPELNAQLRYRTKHLFLGVAANLKTIQPVVPDPSGMLHHSFSWSLFAKATLGQLTVKAQALLNNNLYEGCSMGGYLLRIVNDDPTQMAARDWHFNTYWIDFERSNGHWRPGLFLGYGNNLDFGTPLSTGAVTDYALGRGFNIEYLWRIQPRLTYNTLKGLSFTAEAEYTCAAYGKEVTVGNDRLCLHDDEGRVGNLRLSLSMVYAF